MTTIRTSVKRYAGALTLGGSVLICAAVQAQSPTVTTIENLGLIPASQPQQGLGFNIDPTVPWEWPLAQQAGSTESRFNCEWTGVEIQTSQNTSGGYSLPSACAAGLSLSAQYDMHPVIPAAYGAPYHNIATLQVTAAVPAGSYTIPVTATKGSLGAITIPNSQVLETNGTQITVSGKNSYAGALITAVSTSPGSITLAAATSVALAPGATLTVNQLLYPSAATTDTTDPSIIAYAGQVGQVGGYVGYLADQIYSASLTGKVEIWNEPPWTDDPWDTRYRYYDSNIPVDLSQPAVQFGFAAVLQTQNPPGNVRYIWAGSEKSGFNSMLGSRMSPNPTQGQVMAAMSSESFHPYTNNPEDAAWDPVCLAKLSGWSQCTLTGTDSSNNMKSAVYYDLQYEAAYGWGIEQDITETGLPTSNQVAKARFIMRQFLTFQGLGLKKIDMFTLADAGANYGFVDLNTQIVQPAYTAIAGFMGDLKALGGTPVAGYTAAQLPSVGSYSGYYPLTVVQMVGSSAPTDTTNTVLLTCWQRSYAPTTSVWSSQASPAAVPVTVQLPVGMVALSAINLDTRAVVPFTISGSQVTFNVTDDPVELKVVPAHYTGIAVTANPQIASPGTTIALAATVTGVASGTPTGTVTFYDGSTKLGDASLNNSAIASLSVSSLASGSHNITVQYSGDGNFDASTSPALTVTITAAPVTTTTSLTSSASTVAQGSAVTFTATVTSSVSGTPTGNVTFFDGSLNLGIAPLTSGTATLVTSTLPAGTDSVTAQYGGDTTHSTSTSSAVSVTVNLVPVATALSLSASPVNALAGSAVILTATVSSTSSTTATGSITFYSGTTTIGTGALNGAGVASLSISTLPSGADTISAHYGGDSGHYSSSSAVVVVTIASQPTTTTTTLTASSTTAVAGTSLSFTTVVSSTSNGTPTGNVTFYDGTVSLGVGSLNGSGAATLVVSTLSVGQHNVSVFYGGDSTHNSSSSSVVTVTIAAQPVATSTSLSASVSTTVQGSPVTLSATVTSTANGTPTGSVTFYAGSTVVGIGSLNGAGAASVTTSALSVGVQSLTAQYGGDSGHNASASTAVVVTITAQPVATTTALAASASTVVQGSPVILTATVKSAANGAPTGSVTFYDGSSVVGISTLNGSGVASLTTSSLSVGAQTLTAQYGGDTTHNMSTSTGVIVTITALPVATATVLTSSATMVSEGTAVAFSATVSPTATGTVTFYNGAAALGAGTLSGAGVATLTTAALPAGSSTITAQYAGDATHNPSTSNVIVETVVPPGITLSMNPSSVALSASQPEQVVVTLNPTGGFAQTVSFSCGALPAYMSCAFSPASLTPSGSNTALNTTLALAIDGQTAQMHGAPRPARVPRDATNLAWLAGSALLGSGLKYRSKLLRGRPIPIAVLAVAGLVGLLCLGGCGSSGTAAVVSTDTTPSGSYSLVVTATSATTTASATITLEVP